MSNVIESFVADAKRVLRVAVRRRWPALLTFGALALVVGCAVTLVHDRYQATARVYVDTQTVLKPLMASITFQPDIEQQVSMLARTLISRPNVERLVASPGLELANPDPIAAEQTVNRLMQDIKIVPSGASNLYDISYRGSSPERARRLVEATVNLFVNFGEGAKKRDSKDAGRFIEEQIATYEAKLVESENRLKEFKMRNFGVTGVGTQDYFARVSTLTEEVSKIRVDLNSAEQSRDSYRRELASEDPQLPPELAGKGLAASANESDSRLVAQRKILDDLLRRYTEAHPDVINARRIVAELEAEDAAQKASDAKSGRNHIGNAATSPVYQRLRISLAEAEAQVAALRAQLGAKQALLDQTRDAAGRLPQVEAEFVQMNRDYDIIRKNYDTMVARRESAALGMKLDESSQLAEFRVVEPPRVLPSPVFPSRLHLAIGGLILAFAIAIFTAVAIDQAWPTLDDKESLRELSGRSVLGAISLLSTPSIVRQRRIGALQFLSVAVALVGLQAAWVAWLALQSHPL